MACGVCGDPGHNRRTHSKHEPVQGEALIAQPDRCAHGFAEGLCRQCGTEVPTGADRAREALRERKQGMFAGPTDLLAALQDSVDRAKALRAVGRIADEMDTPHGPGCTVAEPCDECRRYIASNEGEKQDTPIGPDLIEYFTEVDEVIDAITPEETEQKLAEVIAAPVGEWIRVDNLGVGDTVTATPEGTLEVRTSSVVPDEEDRPIAGDIPIFDPNCGCGPDEWCVGCPVEDETDLPTPPWRTVLGPDEPIRITLPGVYDLTAEQYHDIRITGDWLSNSDVKALLKSCPAQFDYDRWHGVRKTSDAFDFGHVWHNRVLGKGEAYRVFEPKKLDGRTKEGKAQRAEVDACRAAGITPIYGDQMALIEAMAQAIEADPVPHALLTAPGRQEVCLFWYETIKVTNPHNKLYGQTVQVKRRAMVDHLPDMPEEDGATVTIVDGKTAEDVKPDDDMRKKIYDYAYHRQAETYAAAVEALFNRVADVVFIFQSKKPPHLIVPVELDTPALRVATAENRQAMEIWAECVATGEWPGYTKGIATSGVPAWIERQFDEELVIG